MKKEMKYWLFINALLKIKKQIKTATVGIPGYVLPQDMNGKLFLKYHHPVKTILTYPHGALVTNKLQHPQSGWQSYSVRGHSWGSARLTITYTDGLVQTINYKVTKPERK